MQQEELLKDNKIMLCAVPSCSVLDTQYDIGKCIKTFTLKPSMLRKAEIQSTLEEEFPNDPDLDLSYVYCFGNSEPTICMMFLRGYETQYFILSARRGHSYDRGCCLVRFGELFENSGLSYVSNFRRMVARWDYKAIMEMENGDLYTFDPILTLVSRFCIPNRREVAHFGFGVMNDELLVSKYSTNESILLIDKNGNECELAFDHVKDIKFMKFFFSSIFLIVLNDNRLFCYVKTSRSARYDGYEIEGNDRFTHIKTPFEKTSPIKDIHVGYAHTVILLENGQVFTKGYNRFGQASIENTSQNTSSIQNEFKEIQFPNSVVKEIGCSSIGTFFKTTTHLLFTGELGYAFEESGDYFDEAKKFNASYAIPIHNNENYSVCVGPWMAFIYKQSFPIVHEFKLFFGRLKEKVGNIVLSDILISNEI